MFNKKFEGKYTTVRRPIICNGLKEIKPFKGRCDLEDPTEPPPVEDSQEPSPEPEPEVSA